jgi:hypothetical protein
MPQDRWDAYQAVLAPARGAAFKMLAVIGGEYSDLDMTADREPTSAELQVDQQLAEEARRTGGSPMRLGLDRAQALIGRAAMATRGSAFESQTEFLLGCCEDARAAFDAALAYLRATEQLR